MAGSASATPEQLRLTQFKDHTHLFAELVDWVVAQGIPGKPWTRISLLNEGGLTPEKWIARFAQEPAP